MDFNDQDRSTQGVYRGDKANSSRYRYPRLGLGDCNRLIPRLSISLAVEHGTHDLFFSPLRFQRHRSRAYGFRTPSPRLETTVMPKFEECLPAMLDNDQKIVHMLVSHGGIYYESLLSCKEQVRKDT
jgi:hypothetical protein